MGVMMILVSQLKGLDGVVSAHPSEYGIVLEIESSESLNGWVSEHPYVLRDDVIENSETIEKSNEFIPLNSPHKLKRLVRESEGEQ